MGKKDNKSAPTAINEADLDAVQGGAVQKVREAAARMLQAWYKAGVVEASQHRVRWRK